MKSKHFFWGEGTKGDVYLAWNLYVAVKGTKADAGLLGVGGRAWMSDGDGDGKKGKRML